MTEIAAATPGLHLLGNAAESKGLICQMIHALTPSGPNAVDDAVQPKMLQTAQLQAQSERDAKRRMGSSTVSWFLLNLSACVALF